ncbi:anti-sigma-K factor RskA [Roseibium hamelinense]|uniref:Anti-sigma-K factor RskA n=1 Tax=Roseibium hamelinense TaxID=150831 RepID=A0A562T1A9_9HYPH|nr:anti-sigma factor [Roseibium hamelinense]MTI44462.1 hypothetical protein [Roseibium hamelinense]TWI87429.1 anti-sigma-K factor RskA [Roseibium hamelinense]
MSQTKRPHSELADEFVIGLLDSVEQAEAEKLLETNAGFAALVEGSRRRFSELDDTVEPQELPADMWSRISGGLDDTAGDAAPQTDTAPETVVPFARPEKSARPRALIVTTAASLAASLILAIALTWNVMTTVEPKVVAVLLNDDGQPVAMIEGTEDNRTLVTMLGDTEVPAGQVLQLWTKPDPDGPPVSVGVFDTPQKTTLSAPALPSPETDQLYEITFEQPGGSPTGLPTGPILGKGFTRQPN